MVTKVIIVTGTPGTGKTRLAKAIAKAKHYDYVDVNKVIASKKLSEGYDKKRKTKIINVSKLTAALLTIIASAKKQGRKGIVIDSHLSHYLPKSAVDQCLVTRSELKTLQQRLKKRGYGKAKIRENIDAEIFEVCLQEAQEQRHKISVVYTDNPLIKHSIKNNFQHIVRKLP